MRRRPTQLICTLIALIAPACVFASEAEQPFSVTIKAPDKPLKAGTELVLRSRIKNMTDHDMTFPTSPGLIPRTGSVTRTRFGMRMVVRLRHQPASLRQRRSERRR